MKLVWTKSCLSFAALPLTIRKGAKWATVQESGTGSLPTFFQIGQLTAGCFGPSHLAPPSPSFFPDPTSQGH